MKQHFGSRNCAGIIKEYNKQVDVVNQSKFEFTPTRTFFGTFMSWWQNLGPKSKSERKKKKNHTQNQSISCFNTGIDQFIYARLNNQPVNKAKAPMQILPSDHAQFCDVLKHKIRQQRLSMEEKRKIIPTFCKVNPKRPEKNRSKRGNI